MASPARKRTQDSDSPAPSATRVVVDNKTSGIKAFWYSHDTESGAYDISGRGASGLCYKLLPGLNDSVPSGLWEVMLKNKTWRKWVEQDVLKVLDKSPLAWPLNDAKGLADRSACVTSMRRWRRAEKRPEMTELLREKITQMSRMSPDTHDNDDNLDIGAAG